MVRCQTILTKIFLGNPLFFIFIILKDKKSKTLYNRFYKYNKGKEYLKNLKRRGEYSKEIWGY